MTIRVLAPHEAAKIAAGEVIERPASVVKELVENSLDADATQVTVEIREGGIALIRVADDGCGIDSGELIIAFERHATSKVAAEDDLWRVRTLGFRGEALPSIAAAGEVELLTRVGVSDVGARVRLLDGIVIEQGSGATSPGTVFSVRRLFAAQPARLKFLRGSGGESTQVTAVVTHYALAYPEVRFTLVVDGKTTLQTTGGGSLLEAIAAIYGSSIASAGIEIESGWRNEGGSGLRGVIIEPRMHRSSRNYISVYINRRWVKNRALTFAIEEAYQGMLPVGRRPIAVVDLRVPPDEVDVNVHPTKAEVRLRNERELFGLLQRTIRRALAENGVVPGASPAVWSGGGLGVATELVLQQTPMQAPLPPPSFLRRDAPEPEQTASPAAVAPVATMLERLPMLRPIGQVGTTYVIAEGPEGMYLIDQHAAHERVLYERYVALVRDGTPDVQGLLQPLTLELGAPHRALLAEHGHSLTQLGFDIAHFGDAAYVVRSVPAPLAGDDVPRQIAELLDRLGRDDGPDASIHRTAASLACHAAVRAGMMMDAHEQRELLRLLEASESPRTCPHGRPTMLHLTADAIAREFKRR